MRIIHIATFVAIVLVGFVPYVWSACEGDTNCDGVVDGTDLVALGLAQK